MISFEYYSKASKQFLCSASWTKPYTYLGSFTNLRLALLVMPTIWVRQGRIFFQGKTFHTNFVCCTKTNMLLNFRNMRNVDIRKFKNWNRNIRNVIRIIIELSKIELYLPLSNDALLRQYIPHSPSPLSTITNPIKWNLRNANYFKLFQPYSN